NDSQLIVMDEPTGSLDAEESSRLLKVCRELADQDVAVVFISHRLEEVMRICDRATVFRDGMVTATLRREEITRDRLIDAIVGREMPAVTTGASRSPSDRPTALDVRDIRRGRSLNGASFRVHQGELLGIAGLVGSGRTELAR